MGEHVCPWWLGYFLASPVRRWMQNPDELIAPYITPGMIVLEPGPGMGFFTLPLARRVGSGRSIRYLVPRAVECYIETHRLYPSAAVQGERGT